MRTKVLIQTSKYLTGTGIAAGILASSTAHAQFLNIQNPNLSLSDETDEFFNFSDPVLQFSTVNTGQQAIMEGPDVLTGLPLGAKDFGSYIQGDGSDSSGLEFTASALNTGDIVDGATLLTDGTSNSAHFAQGTVAYGFELSQNDGQHYGYLVLTQTGTIDETTQVSTLVDTLNTIAYDTTANEAVTIPVVPEPSTLGLLGAAATGLLGLATYRRMRNGAAS